MGSEFIFFKLDDLTEEEDTDMDRKNIIPTGLLEKQIKEDDIYRDLEAEYKIVLLVGGLVRCLVHFIPKESNNLAYITWITCRKRESAGSPKLSVEIIKKVREILKGAGIEWVFLKVMADRGDNFYKLYRHYNKMGFRCVVKEENIKNPNTQGLYNKMAPIKNFTDKAPTRFSEEVYEGWRYYCGKMLAKVDDLVGEAAAAAAAAVGGAAGLEVSFAGKKLVDGAILTKRNTQSKPAIAGLPASGQLLMWDETVPWLHWMLDLRTGMELVPYAPPTPPSGRHLYKIGWFPQGGLAAGSRPGFKINQQPAEATSFYQNSTTNTPTKKMTRKARRISHSR